MKRRKRDNRGSDELMTAFLAGMLSILNPCTLPLMMLYLGFGLRASKRLLVLMIGSLTSVLVLSSIIVSVSGSVEPLITFEPLGYAFITLFGLLILVPKLRTTWSKITSYVALKGLSPKGNESLWWVFMGALLGLTWLPCTGPLIGALLIKLAILGSASRLISYMITYALGFITSLGAVMLMIRAAKGARSNSRGVLNGLWDLYVILPFRWRLRRTAYVITALS